MYKPDNLHEEMLLWSEIFQGRQ